MTSSGYEAESVLNGLVRIWAPCECNLTVNPCTGEQVLTVCQTEGCDFQYALASEAWREMAIDLGRIKLLPERTQGAAESGSNVS